MNMSVHPQHKGTVPTEPVALPSAEWLQLRFTSQDGQLNQADEADKSSQRTNEAAQNVLLPRQKCNSGNRCRGAAGLPVPGNTPRN